MQGDVRGAPQCAPTWGSTERLPATGELWMCSGQEGKHLCYLHSLTWGQQVTSRLFSPAQFCVPGSLPKAVVL